MNKLLETDLTNLAVTTLSFFLVGYNHSRMFEVSEVSYFPRHLPAR